MGSFFLEEKHMDRQLLANFFSFPELINDVAARLVASTVIITCLLIILFMPTNSEFSLYLSFFLLYEFFARTSSGPKISLIALLVTKIIVPKLDLNKKMLPGPPKRFAQFIGLIFSIAITVFIFLQIQYLAVFFISILVFFASLEAFLGYCFGCKVFKFLILVNLIPKRVCEKCNDLNF